MYSALVSTEPVQSKPFLLNRKPQSYVLVYGDDKEKEASKLLWSTLSASDIKIENIDNIQDLKDKISDSVLTFIVVGDDDSNVELCKMLAQEATLIGDIIGLAYEADTDRRIQLVAAGFDSIFNRHMAQSIDFKQIIIRKIEKSRVRQTNRIMQEEYLRFRAALAASPDALIVFDNEGRIFFVSEHYKRAYPNIANRLVRGVPVMEAFEMARIEEGVTTDDPRYNLLKNFWESLCGQIEFESDIGRYKGRTWRMKASPLMDGQGTIVTTTDITSIEMRKREIEEASRQLAESLQKEQEASQLQKQFIGMVSHEFRTPLAIIDGHAQVILRRDDMDRESVQARCKTIRSAVSRLVQMMESILSSNLLKTGRIDPDPEDFDLAALIIELCEEQAELSKSHSIKHDITRIMGPVRLDRKMMTLILTNLISNAVKFTKESPQITVTAATQDDFIIIEVADNGIGIPEDELDKVFERYYRASTSNGIPGTGIGLNLVQQLLSLQGGRVEVKSTLGQGTRFIINLRNAD